MFNRVTVAFDVHIDGKLLAAQL
jgi:hypothetical protein